MRSVSTILVLSETNCPKHFLRATKSNIVNAPISGNVNSLFSQGHLLKCSLFNVFFFKYKQVFCALPNLVNFE